MTDDEFLALPRVQARAYLKGQSRREAKRLGDLYVAQHGPASAAGPLPSASGMLSAGRFFAVLGALLAVLLLMGSATAGPYDDGTVMMIFGWIAASVASIGTFMWMLGAVEQRLIEIRDRLPRPQQ